MTESPRIGDEDETASIDIERHSDVDSSTKETTTTKFRAGLQRFRHLGQESSPTTVISEDQETIRKRSRSIPNHDGADNDPVSPSPSKRRKRESSSYAPPSKYAHLSKLLDILEPNLIGVFVGFNPGVTTATTGHAYAHPSNMFWKLLHSSGVTDTRLRPAQDVDLPQICSMGNTNIVDRPSKNAGELSKAEMAAGTPILEEKIRVFQPEAVCIVGKSIWQAIWRWRYGREMKKDEFRYGWQDWKERMGECEGWNGAWVFVATATSGLNASLKPPEKEEIWRPFGEWVKKRRNERADQEGQVVNKVQAD